MGTSEKKYGKFPVVFGPFSNEDALFERLVDDYPQFFGRKSIDPSKLRRFVQMAIQAAPQIDLDHVSKDELVLFKKQMDREFERNAIAPDDPEFQYDMQVDFQATEPCDWDDE
jgi:hypothetical protein